jgi:hypothetical protein
MSRIRALDDQGHVAVSPRPRVDPSGLRLFTRFAVLTRLISWLTVRRRVVALFVFACVFGSLALHEVVPQYHVDRLKQRGPQWQNHPSFLIGDCPFYRAALISMVKDRDLDLHNNIHPRQYDPASNVAQGERDEWYPKHPIGMPIAAIPFWLLARDLGLITFNLVQLSGLVMLIWLGARRYSSLGVATALTFCYAFCTMLRSTAYNFAPDVFSSLLVTAGIVALLYERPALSGFMLGCALWAKWTNAAFLPLPVLYLGAQRQYRDVLRFGFSAAVPMVALLALNEHMFGSPFVTPYDRVLVRNHGHMVLEASHRTFFTQPFWWGLWDQLTDKEMGLFMACPPFLLVPIGTVLLARRAPFEAALLLSACCIQLAVFAKYDQWRESSYGPRFLMTTLVLSAFLVAPVVQRVFSGRAP